MSAINFYDHTHEGKPVTIVGGDEMVTRVLTSQRLRIALAESGIRGRIVADEQEVPPPPKNFRSHIERMPFPSAIHHGYIEREIGGLALSVEPPLDEFTRAIFSDEYNQVIGAKPVVHSELDEKFDSSEYAVFTSQPNQSVTALPTMPR